MFPQCSEANTQVEVYAHWTNVIVTNLEYLKVISINIGTINVNITKYKGWNCNFTNLSGNGYFNNNKYKSEYLRIN